MSALVDQVRDAVGEHPRLAGAGTGDDEQRAVAVHDRVELIRVESGHLVVGGRGFGIALVDGERL